MGFFATIISTPLRLSGQGNHSNIRVSRQLVESARLNANTLLEQLNTTPTGLTSDEAEARLENLRRQRGGPRKAASFFARLWENIKNPLVILLSLLGLVSYLTGDIRATVVIALMVLLGIVLRFIQEIARRPRRREAAAPWSAPPPPSCATAQKVEIPLHEMVPGDILSTLGRRHGAGRRAPADRQGPVPQPGRAHRRIACRWRRRPACADGTQSEPAGDALPVLPGLQRGKRHRHRGGGHHRQQHLLRLAGRSASPASASSPASIRASTSSPG